MAPASARVLDGLRNRIARIEHAGRLQRGVVPFGVAAIDASLPQGGLVLGALHEIAGGGLGSVHAASAALFVAGVGFTNVANRDWAHLLGGVCYLGFAVTAFRATLPLPTNAPAAD